MGTTESHFGQQVKRLRSSCGMSQEELGFLADLSPSYISKLERGTKSPTIGVVSKLARALGMVGWELMRIAHESMPNESTE